MESVLQNISLTIHTLTPTPAFAAFSLLVVVALYLMKRTYEAAVFAVSVLATLLAVFVIKELFAVPRPEGALVELSSYAFPSGHATLSMTLAMLFSWLMLRHRARSRGWLIPLLFLVTLGVGASRLMIVVHTPLQVLAGFALGAIVPLLVILLGARFYPQGKDTVQNSIL